MTDSINPAAPQQTTGLSYGEISAIRGLLLGYRIGGLLVIIFAVSQCASEAREQWRYHREAVAEKAYCTTWRASLPNDGLSDDERFYQTITKNGGVDGGCWFLSKPIDLSDLPSGTRISNLHVTLQDRQP